MRRGRGLFCGNPNSVLRFCSDAGGEAREGEWNEERNNTGKVRAGGGGGTCVFKYGAVGAEVEAEVMVLQACRYLFLPD